MADEDTTAPHANGNEENGHVPEIELIIKVSVYSREKLTERNISNAGGEMYWIKSAG